MKKTRKKERKKEASKQTIRQYFDTRRSKQGGSLLPNRGLLFSIRDRLEPDPLLPLGALSLLLSALSIPCCSFSIHKSLRDIKPGESPSLSRKESSNVPILSLSLSLSLYFSLTPFCLKKRRRWHSSYPHGIKRATIKVLFSLLFARLETQNATLSFRCSCAAIQFLFSYILFLNGRRDRGLFSLCVL